jgi:hypothetical protein
MNANKKNKASLKNFYSVETFEPVKRVKQPECKHCGYELELICNGVCSYCLKPAE